MHQGRLAPRTKICTTALTQSSSRECRQACQVLGCLPLPVSHQVVVFQTSMLVTAWSGWKVLHTFTTNAIVYCSTTGPYNSSQKQLCMAKHAT